MQLTDVLHESGTAIRRRRGHQQVDMVCHQAVGMQSTFRSPEQMRKVKEIKASVLLFTEAVLPIVTPLDDMHRDARKHDAGAARHSTLNGARVGTLTENVVCP
jgi:hypothetical protein